jgi:hypothetical protein
MKMSSKTKTGASSEAAISSPPEVDSPILALIKAAPYQIEPKSTIRKTRLSTANPKLHRKSENTPSPYDMKSLIATILSEMRRSL